MVKYRCNYFEKLKNLNVVRKKSARKRNRFTSLEWNLIIRMAVLSTLVRCWGNCWEMEENTNGSVSSPESLQRWRRTSSRSFRNLIHVTRSKVTKQGVSFACQSNRTPNSTLLSIQFQSLKRQSIPHCEQRKSRIITVLAFQLEFMKN